MTHSLHHLALGARDVRRVSDFYRGAFGLSPLREHFYEDGSLRSVWLMMGSTVLMVEHTNEESLRVEGVGAGPFLLAFPVTPGERDEREQELDRLGAPIESRSEYSSYARDPEGNRIALSCYPVP